jgi:ketosteroid isomerase-like protein
MTATTAGRSTANVTTVKEIYDAFGRGDIPAVLSKIAPDCRWESWENNRAQRAGVPTLQPRTGPDGVAQFFAAVGELDISDFQVLDILPGDRQVAVEVVIDYTTPVGGRLRDEEVHLWTLDDAQRVTRLRHYVDTAKHIAAYAGEDTVTGVSGG